MTPVWAQAWSDFRNITMLSSRTRPTDYGAQKQALLTLVLRPATSLREYTQKRRFPISKQLNSNQYYLTQSSNSPSRQARIYSCRLLEQREQPTETRQKEEYMDRKRSGNFKRLMWWAQTPTKSFQKPYHQTPVLSTLCMYILGTPIERRHIWLDSTKLTGVVRTWVYKIRANTGRRKLYYHTTSNRPEGTTKLQSPQRYSWGLYRKSW